MTINLNNIILDIIENFINIAEQTNHNYSFVIGNQTICNSKRIDGNIIFQFQGIGKDIVMDEIDI